MPEAQETSDKSKETTASPAEKAKEPTSAPAKAATEETKAKVAEPVKEADKSKREPKRLTGDEEPDDGEDEGLFTLSGAALRKRMARFTRRELREKFGTDDPEKIQVDLAELKTLREEKETRRLEQLTKEQRLVEERKAARRETEEARAALKFLEDERDVEQVSTQFARLAAKHLDADLVDDDDWRVALFSKLRKHLQEETGGVASKITDKIVEKFFGEYAKEKPQFAKRSNERPVEVEVESGSKAPAAPPGNGAPPGQAGVKTARPGQPNSMTAAEIRQAGYKW